MEFLTGTASRCVLRPHGEKSKRGADQWQVSGDGGAAELLGMKPTTLEARMKKLGIKRTG
jgi:hypothetical protein